MPASTVEEMSELPLVPNKGVMLLTGSRQIGCELVKVNEAVAVEEAVRVWLIEPVCEMEAVSVREEVNELDCEGETVPVCVKLGVLAIVEDPVLDCDEDGVPVVALLGVAVELGVPEREEEPVLVSV